MEQQLTALADGIEEAATVVAFTGAGVSTASGIPDFRGEGGIWEKHDPGMFNITAVRRNPGDFWEMLLAVHDEAFAGDPEPNPAHEALASLESRGQLESIITQNADGLHQAAGSEDVIELHGNLERTVCQSCRHREPFDDARRRAESGELPPTCEECGGTLKPDAVLFGEQLPEHAIMRSHALAERADVFLVAGSSLRVEPAATLPETARDHGATLAIVNLEPTKHDDSADFVFHEDVTDVLPRIESAVS